MSGFRYKIYFFDITINETYPIVIPDNLRNISELACWINEYVKVFNFNMEVVSGIIIDHNNIRIADIKFQPYEIMYQYFYTSLESRLLAHDGYHKEVGVKY